MTSERARAVAIATPAAVLLAVAALQVCLAHWTALSPWKGAGFGMFACTDGLPTRWVRAYALAPERTEELDLPPHLALAADRVATWPRRGALVRLGQALLEREGHRGRPATAVHVEVWLAEVGPFLEVTERLLRETTVGADEEVRRVVAR